jgi:hypothetical protein
MDSLDYSCRYPEWLGDALLRKTLPWDGGLPVPMPFFLQNYSLHDSIWEGLWVEPAYGEATAIVRWDSYWSDGRIPYPKSVDGSDAPVGEWPLLLIRFQHVYQIVSSQTSFDEPLTPDIMMVAQSRHVPEYERDELLTARLRQPLSTDNSLVYLLDEALYHTEIVGLQQEWTRAIHWPTIWKDN